MLNLLMDLTILRWHKFGDAFLDKSSTEVYNVKRVLNLPRHTIEIGCWTVKFYEIETFVSHYMEKGGHFTQLFFITIHNATEIVHLDEIHYLISIHFDVSFNVDEIGQAFFRFFLPILINLNRFFSVCIQLFHCLILDWIDQFDVSTILSFNARLLTLKEVAHILLLNNKGMV